jgi:hypothetical protein
MTIAATNQMASQEAFLPIATILRAGGIAGPLPVTRGAIALLPAQWK